MSWLNACRDRITKRRVLLEMDYSATKQMKCSSKYVFQLLGFQLLAILSVGGRSTVSDGEVLVAH